MNVLGRLLVMKGDVFGLGAVVSACALGKLRQTRVMR